MATYITLNTVFIFVALAAVYKLKGEARLFSKRSAIVLLCLLLLTFIFDNMIISAGIVAYDTTKLLGAYLISAPIEDFFYSLAAIIVLPAIWERLKGRE